MSETKNDLVLVPREIVANYANSTFIPRHRRICEAALSSTSELERIDRMAGWQPIETAPKDGTMIMVCEDGQIDLAQWQLSVFGETHHHWNYMGGLSQHIAGYKPTHWMPLPAPPTPTADGP